MKPLVLASVAVVAFLFGVVADRWLLPSSGRYLLRNGSFPTSIGIENSGRFEHAEEKALLKIDTFTGRVWKYYTITTIMEKNPTETKTVAGWEELREVREYLK